MHMKFGTILFAFLCPNFVCIDLYCRRVKIRIKDSGSVHLFSAVTVDGQHYSACRRVRLYGVCLIGIDGTHSLCLSQKMNKPRDWRQTD